MGHPFRLVVEQTPSLHHGGKTPWDQPLLPPQPTQTAVLSNAPRRLQCPFCFLDTLTAFMTSGLCTCSSFCVESCGPQSAMTGSYPLS